MKIIVVSQRGNYFYEKKNVNHGIKIYGCVMLGWHEKIEEGTFPNCNSRYLKSWLGEGPIIAR